MVEPTSGKVTCCALVTGANKGIGYEIVRQLSPVFSGTVYLAARDIQRGKLAAEALQHEGIHNVQFLQLDVTDRKSIETACDFIKAKHGGLDVLINNAGIFQRPAENSEKPVGELAFDAARDTIGTNFTGLLDVCKVFFPILRSHARVVNVSSSLGSLRNIKSIDIKTQLIQDTLTVAQLEAIVADYLRAASEGNSVAAGYPDRTGFGPYTMSKIAVTALTRIQQRDFDQDKSRIDIIVNSCCPGYVATDLNNHSGHKTTQQGAVTPVYLALLPPDIPSHPRGEFLYEKRVINWCGEEPTHP